MNIHISPDFKKKRKSSFQWLSTCFLQFWCQILIKNLYIGESKIILEDFPILVQQVRFQFPTCISYLILNHPLGAQTDKTCIACPAVISQFRNQLDSEMMTGKNDAVLQGGIYYREEFITLRLAWNAAHSLMPVYFLVSFFYSFSVASLEITLKTWWINTSIMKMPHQDFWQVSRPLK